MTAAVLPLLTARQRRVLDYLRSHCLEHGYCPTVREVAAACGYASASTAAYQLRQLEHAGWIARVPGKARAIRILNPADGSDT